MESVEIPLSEVKRAIQIVTAVMDNLSIKGDKAAKWAITREILVELEAFTDRSLAEHNKRQEQENPPSEGDKQSQIAESSKAEESAPMAPESSPEPSAEA